MSKPAVLSRETLYIARHNGKQVLIALDQGVHSLLWFVLTPVLRERVYADETLSSRFWRWCKDGTRSWPRKITDILFFWDKNHCAESYESERTGSQLPPELRK